MIATPKDVIEVYGHTAPNGKWVSISGRLRARGSAEASFLYDTGSGRFIKRPTSGGGSVVFSVDGTRGAWLQEDPGFFEWKRTGVLRIATLDPSGPATITFDVKTSVWTSLALSPSGRRIAVYDGNVLTAYDVSDLSKPRQILAVRKNTSRSFAFVGEDTVRLSPRPYYPPNRKEIAPPELEIEEISLLSRKSLVTGRIENDALANLRARISADGRYLVEESDKRLTLHDGRTGGLLATLSEDLAAPKMRFLSGDRIVVAGVAEGKGILKIFIEGERTPSRVVELGAARTVVLGGEVAPGHIAVSLSPFRSNDERSRRAWKLAFVDVATGAVSSGPEGLVPLDRYSWWFSPVLPPAEAGLPASTLFLDASSRLVRLDPATGAQTVLLGRSK